MKKEIPILFSTPMVQAILAGRKTTTRRVIKPQPDPEDQPYFMANPPLDWVGEWKPWKYDTGEGESKQVDCPYGQPGDILYVRENWKIEGWCWDDSEVVVTYGDSQQIRFEIPDDLDGKSYQWAVDYVESLIAKGIYAPISEESEEMKFTGKPHPFKPSIHLPKWLSRIWLQVVDVRVERLHDITEDDAEAEGVETLGLYPGYDISSRGKFEGLWNLINGERSWDANPWVWVIEFKVLSTDGKPESL